MQMDESQLEQLEITARKYLEKVDDISDVLTNLENSEDSTIQVFMQPGIDTHGLITLKTGGEKWFKHKFTPYSFVVTFNSWSEYCKSLNKGELHMLENLNKAILTRKDGHVLEQINIKDTDVVYKNYEGTRGIVPNSLISYLWKRIIELEQKVSEINDAPGMPGYEKARASFYENVKKQ